MTSPPDETPKLLWVAGAAALLAVTCLAAMTALGPLFFGCQLLLSELKGRRFGRVLRPADLRARGARVGDALAGLEAAAARAEHEGREAGLARRADGYFFEGRGAKVEALNQRLTQLYLARLQLGYEYNLGLREWAAAISRRSTARIGGLLFVIVVLVLCAYEPIGATVLFFGRESLSWPRLAASGIGVVVALGAMSVFGRAAEQMLLAGFPDLAHGGPAAGAGR